MSYNICTSRSECSMAQREEGEMNVVAILRLTMASMSILGAMSIVGSATYRKTACNPKVHPIFVLSIVDALLSLLWVSGSVVWLKRGALDHTGSIGGCFSINLLTVVLQCVAMNVTLIYALLAYSSIRQRDFSRLYVVQQRPVSVHAWPPLCSFLSYFIAWTLPLALVLPPFTVLSVKYGLVQKANDCSCWCLPFYGNVLPRLQLGSTNNAAQGEYKLLLHYFITSYSVVLATNLSVVMCSLVVVYCKVFLRIRRMALIQGQGEGVPLLGATQAMILAGQKDTKRRVTFFLSIFFLSGMITFAFGVSSIITEVQQIQHHHSHNHHHHTTETLEKYYIFLLFEAILVPIQGFLNALAYGWTRGDFVRVMSSQEISPLAQAMNVSLSPPYGAVDEEERERVDEGEGETCYRAGVRVREDGSMSPVSLHVEGEDEDKD